MSGIKITRDKKADFDDFDCEDDFPEKKKGSLVPVAIVTLVLSAITVGVLIWKNQQITRKQLLSQKFVYLEISVKDEANKALEGVEIFLGKKQVGVSDISGEWRRFLKLKPGSDILVTARKKVDNGSYFSSRNYIVPLRASASGDYEIKESLNLKFSGSYKNDTKTKLVMERQPLSASGVESNQLNGSTELNNSDESKTKTQELEKGIPGRILTSIQFLEDRNSQLQEKRDSYNLELQELKKRIAEIQGQQVTLNQEFTETGKKLTKLKDAYHRAKQELSANEKTIELPESEKMIARSLPQQTKAQQKLRMPSLDSIAIQQVGRNNGNSKWGYHIGHVETSLKQRASQLGIDNSPNAGWKVFIKDTTIIEDDKPKKLILVSFNTEGSGSNQFIVNYQREPIKTAKRILWNLKLHIARHYLVTKVGDAWVIDGYANLPKLWKLKNGDSVVTSQNTSLRVAFVNRQMQIFGGVPCRSGERSCFVQKKKVPDISPRPRWVKRQLKINGDISGTKVFASGFLAKPLSGNNFEFWAPRTGKSILTLVRGRKVVLRQKVLNYKPGIVQLAISAGTFAKKP